jgi:ABC-type transport system involved in cytochrome c biogenesis permease subunit
MKARRIVFGSVAALAVIAGLLIWWVIEARRPQLELGVGYAARVACGCRYIGNRSLTDCRKDFEPGMEPIQLAENAATRTITASVPLISSRSVRFDPVLACQPEPFTGKPLVVKP